MEIKLSFTDLHKLEGTTQAYPIVLLPSQLRPTPNVISVSSLNAYLTVYPLDYGSQEEVAEVTVSIKGNCLISDDYTLKPLKYEISQEETVTVSGDQESSDIAIDNGNFDFMPVILSLFYNGIPSTMHEAAKCSAHGQCKVLSQEEYAKLKEKTEKEASPFSVLDPDEFPAK